MVGGDAGGRFAGPIGTILAGTLLTLFVPQTIKTFTVEPDRTDLEELARLVVAGAVRVVCERPIGFDAIPREIESLQGGRTIGKVVALTPGSSWPSRTSSKAPTTRIRASTRRSWRLQLSLSSRASLPTA
jgi:hypothetical protein